MYHPLSFKQIALAALLSLGVAMLTSTPGLAAGDGGNAGGGGGAGAGGDSNSAGGGGMGGGMGGEGRGDPTMMRPGTTRPAARVPMPSCGRGLMFDARRNGCVPMRRGEIDDETLYGQGARLAVDGRYEDAIAILSLIERQDDARVLNYLGFSNRKLGNLEVGLDYYHRAISADPKYTLVREYLGEAYIQLGRVDLAKDQLKVIEGLCGTTCEPYRDLAEELARAEKQG